MEIQERLRFLERPQKASQHPCLLFTNTWETVPVALTLHGCLFWSDNRFADSLCGVCVGSYDDGPHALFWPSGCGRHSCTLVPHGLPISLPLYPDCVPLLFHFLSAAASPINTNTHTHANWSDQVTPVILTTVRHMMWRVIYRKKS